jgi:2-oxoglutarate dehydrogenase complex dehydrogenase (E1) component-like enzyme
VEYVGRRNSASPATGSKRRHDVEQSAIVDGTFTGARDRAQGTPAA